MSIKDIAFLIKDMIGFKGEIAFDTSKPDGSLVKVLDISKIKAMGWLPRISLQEGIYETYQWYLGNK